jgi:FkbM family methyltransferase
MTLTLDYGTFELPDSDETAFSSAREGFWDHDLRPYMDVPRGGVVIDVGAHVGLYSVYWAAKGALVYALEAHPFYLPYLMTNTVANGRQDRIVHLPFFAYSYSTRMQERPDHPTRASNTWLPGGGHDDPLALPLDNFEGAMDRLDLLKVDAQGADLHVLMGAERLITRYHPRILLEYEGQLTAQHGHTADDYRAWIAAHNYEEHSINGWNALLTWRGL